MAKTSSPTRASSTGSPPAWPSRQPLGAPPAAPISENDTPFVRSGPLSCCSPLIAGRYRRRSADRRKRNQSPVATRSSASAASPFASSAGTAASGASWVALQVPPVPENGPPVTAKPPPMVVGAVRTGAAPVRTGAPVTAPVKLAVPRAPPPITTPMFTVLPFTVPFRPADTDDGHAIPPEVSLTEMSPPNWLPAWDTLAVPWKLHEFATTAWPPALGRVCIWMDQEPVTLRP